MLQVIRKGFTLIRWIAMLSAFFCGHHEEVTAISNELLINEAITEKEIRLIGSHGEQIGIMTPQEALAKAQEEDLDLVLIAPNAKPPVAKIIDYSKYR